MIVREITPILIIRPDESFKMMSNRIANVCLTNLCRRNISSTVLSLQRKKKFTKAQVGLKTKRNCSMKSSPFDSDFSVAINRFKSYQS